MEIKTHHTHRKVGRRPTYVARFRLRIQPVDTCKVIGLQLGGHRAPDRQQMRTMPQRIARSVENRPENDVGDAQAAAPEVRMRVVWSRKRAHKLMRRMREWVRRRIRRSSRWLETVVETPNEPHLSELLSESFAPL